MHRQRRQDKFWRAKIITSKLIEKEVAMPNFGLTQAHVDSDDDYQKNRDYDEVNSYNDVHRKDDQGISHCFQVRNLDILDTNLWFNVWYGI